MGMGEAEPVPPESNESNSILTRLIHKANPVLLIESVGMLPDSKDIIFGDFINAV